MNYAILAICGALFLFQLGLGKDVDAFVLAYGFVPNELRESVGAADPQRTLRALGTVITAMFLHGGWFHVGGNLLYLRVFGDNIEDRFGHLGFVGFYVASGLAGAAAQYAFDPSATVPMIGASGAIAGVLGAYVVMFPAAKVVTLFPIFIFLTFIEVPAFFFLGLWAAQQLLNGYLTLGRVGPEPVAWFAHLGGFALGVTAGIVFRLVRRRKK